MDASAEDGCPPLLSSRPLLADLFSAPATSVGVAITDATLRDICSAEADVADPLAPLPCSLSLELAITSGPPEEVETRELDFTLIGSLPAIPEEEEEGEAIDTCVSRELMPLT